MAGGGSSVPLQRAMHCCQHGMGLSMKDLECLQELVLLMHLQLCIITTVVAVSCCAKFNCVSRIAARVAVGSYGMVQHCHAPGQWPGSRDEYGARCSLFHALLRRDMALCLNTIEVASN